MPRRKNPFNPARPPKSQQRYGKERRGIEMDVKIVCPNCGVCEYWNCAQPGVMAWSLSKMCWECGASKGVDGTFVESPKRKKRKI